MPSARDSFKALLQQNLSVRDIFSVLPVEYRDELAMMHLKTLDSEDIENLVRVSARASKKKRRSKKRSSRRRRSRR
jgi:hypothetical protein